MLGDQDSLTEARLPNITLVLDLNKSTDNMFVKYFNKYGVFCELFWPGRNVTKSW